MRKIAWFCLIFIAWQAQPVQAQNPWIQPIVQSVSGDSIFATIAELQTMDRVSSNNCMVASYYLQQRLWDCKPDTVFFQYFKPGTPPNVIGIWYGTLLPNEYWVMGAHYDAVLPYAGADDNGSGTAAVLEMARVIAEYELEKSLMLVLFSAEEVGLWGSNAFVDSAINYFNIQGMINLDMIAYSHNLMDSSVSVCWKHFCSGLMQDYQTACSLYVPELIIETDSTSGLIYASDHAPFWSKMIPALFLIENSDRWGGAFNPYYHQLSDTIGMGANSNWLAEKISRSAIATLLLITSPYSTINTNDPIADPSPLYFCPNPAKTIITLHGEGNLTHGINIRLFDQAGRLILAGNGLPSGFDLDISWLSIGIYTVRMEDGKNIKTLKLVRSRE